MKTILYFAATLMLISGIMHVLPVLKIVSESDAPAMFGFGVVILVIAVLLFMGKKLGQIFAVILTPIGLFVGFGVVGLKNWDAFLAVLFIIDAAVLVCCLTLLLNKKKVPAAT